MSIKLISIKCPECDAALQIEKGRKQCFCTYCGSKIMLENDHEYVYRHIDEAKVKEAETDRMIRLKEIEIEEQRRLEIKKQKDFKVKLSIALGVIAFLGLGIGYTFDSAIGFMVVGFIAVLILAFMWLDDRK